MSDLHRADLHQEKLPILAAPPHESRIMVAVAMTAIALAFVLSLAVAVSSIGVVLRSPRCRLGTVTKRPL